MKKNISVIILCFLVSGIVSSAGRPVNIEGVINLGMGGPGTAIYTKNYAVLYNPALLGAKKGLKIGIDTPISISHDVFKFYKFYKDNDLGDFLNLSVEEQAKLMKEITDVVTKYTVRFKLGVLNPNISVGPFPIMGSTGSLWWGAGFFNQADMGVKMNPGILVPTVDFWVRIDGVFVFPVLYRTRYIPFRLPGEINLGINFKYIMRSKIEKNKVSILDFNSILDINADDLKPGSGIGWDWGAMYDYNEKWNFALVINDFLSSKISYPNGTGEVIKGSFNLGASYKLNDMITFAGDIRDIKFSDIGKSTFFTKLYFGSEFNLKLVKLRGGFYQGYPSFGLTAFGFLNYAFYGRELGMYPGYKPLWNHTISLSVNF